MKDNKHFFFTCALALFLMFASTGVSYATHKVGHVQAIQLEFIRGNVLAGPQNKQILYTVPAGKKFTLTDALYTRNVIGLANTAGANLGRSSDGGTTYQTLHRSFVTGNENVLIHLQTGFEYIEGESIVFVAGGAGGIHVTIIGTEEDAP